jgi:membrane protease YdiL (CAAX protease family)
MQIQNMQFFDWDVFRRDVKRDVRNCVLFLAGALLINTLVAMVVQIFALFLDPSIIDQLLSAATAAAPYDIDAIMDSMGNMDGTLMSLSAMAGAVAGPLLFIVYRKRRFFGDVLMPPREKLTPRILVMLIVATQGIQFVFGLLILLAEFLLEPTGVSLSGDYNNIISALINPLGLVYIVLVGPIFEELVFRGAILGALRKYGENFAIIMSAVLFGFFHMVILQIPFAFVMGMLFGYVASRFSLRASILLHIIVNGLSLLFSESGAAAESIGGYAMLVCGVATLILLLCYRRQLRARIRLGASYYGGTFQHGLTSIPFLIFCAGALAVGLLQVLLGV